MALQHRQYTRSFVKAQGRQCGIFPSYGHQEAAQRSRGFVMLEKRALSLLAFFTFKASLLPFLQRDIRYCGRQVTPSLESWGWSSEPDPQKEE